MSSDILRSLRYAYFDSEMAISTYFETSKDPVRVNGEITSNWWIDLRRLSYFFLVYCREVHAITEILKHIQNKELFSQYRDLASIKLACLVKNKQTHAKKDGDIVTFRYLDDQKMIFNLYELPLHSIGSDGCMFYSEFENLISPLLQKNKSRLLSESSLIAIKIKNHNEYYSVDDLLRTIYEMRSKTRDLLKTLGVDIEWKA